MLAYINENFSKLHERYIFSEVAQKVKDFQKSNTNMEVIHMGIGDVTLPLSKYIAKELYKSIDNMTDIDKFKGYAPEQGYEFLRNAIVEEYHNKGVDLFIEEIFVNDGSKGDLGNIIDIFDEESSIGISSLGYPVYAEVATMRNSKIIKFKSSESNEFLPLPQDNVSGEIPDLIYICSPNNPTGTAYNFEELSCWVNYANQNGSVILYDSAYEAFIDGTDIPRSIYQIEGAKDCAIEFCSFSKSAGFTGMRCGYIVIPNKLNRGTKLNVGIGNINALWRRRQSTRFNGVSYLIQRAAWASLSPQVKLEIDENIFYYKNNSKLIMDTMENCNIKYWGGINSPYIWIKCPGGRTSIECFEYFLTSMRIVTTPGLGFGEDGEGYLRVSTFGLRQDVSKACSILSSELTLQL